METLGHPGKGQRLLKSVKIGISTGLAGGTIVALIESTGVLIAMLGPPASSQAIQVVKLVAGLLFLSALTACGTALGLGILGGLIGLWQVVKGATISSRQQATVLSTAFTVLYVLFRAVDRLGIQELRQSGSKAAIWAAFLLFLAVGAGCAAWCVFRRLFRDVDDTSVKKDGIP